MNDQAPKATLTSAMWDWTVHNKPTINGVCSGSLAQGRQGDHPAGVPQLDGLVQRRHGPGRAAEPAALANHPRKDQIQKLYTDEVAAFKSGAKSFTTVFTGPIKDNTGQVRIEGAPDVAALYDERGQWFVENVVGSPTP